MLQAQDKTQLLENSNRKLSFADSNSGSDSPKNNLFPNFLNTIQITHSRITSNLGERQNSNDYIIEEQNRFKGCPKCVAWENWAKQSETALLKIQKDFIQKQERLRFVVSEMKKQLQKHEEQGLVHEKKLSERSHKNEEKFNELIKLNQTFEREIIKLQNYIFCQDEKEKRILKQNIVLKKEVSKKAQNCELSENLLHPSWQKGLKVRGKSKLQQSLTDCSLFKDCRDQGQVTDDYGSMNSRWKNTNYYNQENKESHKRGCVQERDTDLLTFENENLKSYNRVLLQKLNLHKRFGKY